jgi:hypothetical protein
MGTRLHLRRMRVVEVAVDEPDLIEGGGRRPALGGALPGVWVHHDEGA